MTRELHDSQGRLLGTVDDESPHSWIEQLRSQGVEVDAETAPSWWSWKPFEGEEDKTMESTDTVLDGQLEFEKCPDCGGAVHNVVEPTTNERWLECTAGCGWNDYDDDQDDDQDDAPDPAVRDAESNFRLNNYLRNENATISKWAAGGLASHPFADLMPMMTDEEHAKLVASIESTGYDREAAPIILLGGRILDGRNRAKAAREVWLRHQDDADAERYQPTFREFMGTELAALGFVKRHGLDRRQLSASQVALIGSELHERLVGLRKVSKEMSGVSKEMSGGRQHRRDYTDDFDSDDDDYGDEFGDVDAIEGRSSAFVANLTGASERSVERMNRIRSKATAELLGEKRHAEILEGIRNKTITARAAEDEIAAAKMARAAEKAQAEANAAAEAAANKLGATDAQAWPGKTMLAAHGRRIQQSDAIALLKAIEPLTAATIVLDPPPLRDGDEDKFLTMLNAAEKALAPGGDVWVIADVALLAMAAEVFTEGDDRWMQRAVLAWDDTGPLAEPWSWAPKFLLWLTRKGDRVPRAVKLAAEVLGNGPLLQLGAPSSAETRYLRHPQQRPEALYDGLLAIGTGLVVVPHCGTGAAVVSAVRRGRPVIAGDLVVDYLNATVLRVKDLDTGTSKPKAEPKAKKKAEPKAKKKAEPKAKKKAEPKAKKKAPPKPPKAEPTEAKPKKGAKKTAKKGGK